MQLHMPQQQMLHAVYKPVAPVHVMPTYAKSDSRSASKLASFPNTQMTDDDLDGHWSQSSFFASPSTALRWAFPDLAVNVRVSF